MAFWSPAFYLRYRASEVPVPCSPCTHSVRSFRAQTSFCSSSRSVFFFFSSVLGCLTCPVFKRGDEECDWILPLKADDGLFGFSSEDWIIQLKAKKKNDTRIGAYYIQLSAAIPCIWSRRAQEMIDTGLKRMWIHPIWHLWRGIAWTWSMLSGCICLTWAGAVGPAVCFQPRSWAKQ